ncbi:MAG: site-specific integrase [Pseudomonadota bacterium]
MPQPECSKTPEMRLYSDQNERLYLNEYERAIFLREALKAPLHIRAFALTLLFSGCRLSEARFLTQDMVQIDEGKLSIRSLKKRGRHHIREVPVPEMLITTLNTQFQMQNQRKLIWAMSDEPVSRIKAYRWIKSVFHKCKLQGPHACPRGLRHGFGVHAICSGVQLHMVQRWMGHASIETTSIYTQASGPEERLIAERMW